MDLGRAVAKFAKNDILGWNPDRACFEPTGKKGSLQVYDRFISDRTFGTKKRILLLPKRDVIPSRYEYVRVGDGLARFMVDAMNEDVYADIPYANCYLMREAKFKVEIGFMQGQTRASGSGGKSEFVVESTVFGDYERYKSDNSTELHTVDYTVSDIFLPLSAQVTSGNLLRIDGKLYDVTEVARVSNLLWVRGQKMEEDVTPEVQRGNLYTCDMVCYFDKPDVVSANFNPVDGISLLLNNPCQHRIIKMNYSLNGPIAVSATGVSANMAIYDSSRTLIESTEGEVELLATFASSAPWYLAIIPSTPEGEGTLNVLVTNLD